MEWLRREKSKTPKPSLLILASAGVPSDELAELFSLAQDAGFSVIWGALDPTAPGAGSK
jgi:hypothetical protein